MYTFVFIHVFIFVYMHIFVIYACIHIHMYVRNNYSSVLTGSLLYIYIYMREK